MSYFSLSFLPWRLTSLTGPRVSASRQALCPEPRPLTQGTDAGPGSLQLLTVQARLGPKPKGHRSLRAVIGLPVWPERARSHTGFELWKVILAWVYHLFVSFLKTLSFAFLVTSPHSPLSPQNKPVGLPGSPERTWQDTSHQNAVVPRTQEGFTRHLSRLAVQIHIRFHEIPERKFKPANCLSGKTQPQLPVPSCLEMRAAGQSPACSANTLKFRGR